jgi:hypothetical protein
MKQSLGRIIVGIMILHSTLWGMNYHWNVVESPASLRVGQSGVIRYACTYEGSAAEYSTKLKLIDSPQYATSVLSERSQVTKGKRTDTIDLLVTPKISGVFSVEMRATIRYTSPGAIENTVLGRDNLSREDISESEVSLPLVTIRSEENSASLTGNITMEVHADQTTVRAHEPIHLSVIIKGSGNLEKFVPYELNISGVRIFAEPPQKLLSPSRDGVEGEIRQEFALVSEKSFVIPKITLDVFDTTTQKMKRLESEAVSIEVAQGYERSNLLDPPVLVEWSNWMRYALYAGLVVFGIVLGEVVRRVWKMRPRRKRKQFYDDAKTTKELVMLLALTGERAYEPMISELEAGTLDLREAKKRLDAYPARSSV